MLKVILSASVMISCLSACDRMEVDCSQLAAISKEVLETRKKHALAIRATMVECLSNSNKNRDVVSNDSAEAISACRDFAMVTYGATSPYREERLLELANGFCE